MQQRQDSPFVRDILSQFEQDEIQTTKHILTQIDNNSPDTLKLLQTLNILLNTKALPARQRRDVAAIARLVADSHIFTCLQAHITTQTQNYTLPVAPSVYFQSIKLIGSICWQNPHFIDNIVTSSPHIIELLFDRLAHPLTIPPSEDALVIITNFFHSISLKEGHLRDHKLPKVFTSFIENIFTHDRFYDCLDNKKISVLFAAIHKFYSNVKQIDKYIYNALIKSIKYVNEEYKNIANSFQKLQSIRQSQTEDQQRGKDISEMKKKVRMTDRKLIGLLKLEEKSRSSLFQKIDAFNFTIFLKIIAKIAVSRPIVLVDSTYDNKILISSITQTIRFIKEWKDHLYDKFQARKQEMQQEEKIQELQGQLQENILEDMQEEIQEDIPEKEIPEMQQVSSQMAQESPCIRQHFTSQTANNFLEAKEDCISFEQLNNKICKFSVNYFRIAINTIHNIKHIHKQMSNYEKSNPIDHNVDENIPKDQSLQAYSLLNFKLQFEASRLDRILTILIKLIEEKQLMKEDYYKQIVKELYQILPVFTLKGQMSQLKIIQSIIPDLKNMTIQSDLSNNRFIFEKLDEDSLKSSLHQKITSIPNSYNIISDTIIRFCAHLSEYPEYLEHSCTHFFHKIFLYCQQHYLQKINQKSSLSLKDIEMLRMMVKIISQLFPSNHKCMKEEIGKLKLYHYCIMVQNNQCPISIFQFTANVINLLDKHNPAATEQLQDTLQNRKEVVKTIFYKLITHRLKIFFATIANFYHQLYKLSTPKTIISPIGIIQLEKELMFTGPLAYVSCQQKTLRIILVQTRQNSLKDEAVGLLLMHLFDFRRIPAQDEEYNQISIQEDSLIQWKQKELDKLNKQLQQKRQEFFKWIIPKITSHIVKLPMIIKAVLQFRKEEQLFVFGSAKTSQNQMKIQFAAKYYWQFSKIISDSYFCIQGKYLDLGIKVNKKKKTDIELIEQPDLKSEVIKLSNICIIISQFMIQYSESKLTERNINTISQKYINSLIDFSLLYLTKFAAEIHFPEEANRLIRSTLWLIQNYLAYKNILIEFKQQKKKQKKRQYKKSLRNRAKGRKQAIKAAKIQSKNIILKQKSLTNNQNRQFTQRIKWITQDISSKIQSHKKKEMRKRKRKNNIQIVNTNKRQGQTRTLHKNCSKTNLHSQSSLKNKTNSTTNRKEKTTKSIFHIKVEQYLKKILQASNKGQKPLLKNLTLQYYLKFISTHLKKNYISKPPYKYFQLSLIDYIQQLMKLELSDHKNAGYHLYCPDQA